MDFRGQKTAPTGGVNLPHYCKMRAEDFVRKCALSNRGGQSGRQSKTAQEAGSPVRTVVDGLLKLVGRAEAKDERPGARYAASSGPRGPLYRAVITCKVTECAPSSGPSISVGEWCGKQTARSRATRNGELVGWRKDTRPTKKAPARRPACGEMVIPSAWPGK